MSTATVATKKKPKTNATTAQKSSASKAKPPVKAKPPIAIVAPAAPVEPAPAVNTDLVHEVPHALGSVWRERRSNIRRSATNPRTVFALDDLLATMPTQGQLSPILVRFRPDTDTDTDYELVAGERRFRAAGELGWPDIEVKLVEMTDEQVEEVQLVENAARADLTPLDEAHAFERLERRGYSVQQIADRVGKRQDYIRQRLALARLTDEAKAALRDGAISVGAAQELASVTDPSEQRRVVARALEGRVAGADPMSAKQIRMFVEQSLLVLSKAKFPLADATLLPSAGACTTCPKRSSQQYALIALPGADADERCTDRSCFVAKQEAHWTRAKCDAIAAGQMVIEGDAARKVIAFGGIAKDSGLVDLDAHCTELRDGRTWRDVLADVPLPITLVRGAEGAAYTTVGKADAVRVLRERGLLRAPEPAKHAAPVATAGDTAPESEEQPSAVAGDEPVEPTLLTVDELARAAKRARLDSGTFAALADAIILLSEPRPAETQAICKPYDVPVPEDVEGHDVVLGIARGLTSDGDRLALVVRALCVNPKARARLSAHFAPGQIPDASIADAKERVLHAIRTGAAKPAQIRAAAGVDETTWERVIAALKADGSVVAEGRGRGQTYTAVDAPPADPETTETEPPADALAVSAVDDGIRANVRDLLARGSLFRSELVLQLAEIEGFSEADAGHEIETLIREGQLSEQGASIEWADHRDPMPFDTSPEVVF